METYFFAQQVNRSRGIGMIDTLEKKVVRGVAVQQQQQLSIEILTNLSIKTSTRYYRKCAVLKQKPRSRSRNILLSSKVFVQTMAQGIRVQVGCSKQQGINYKQQVSIETLANLLICQQISIDTLSNLLNWAIGIDRYPCKPITLSNRYRSISSHTYRLSLIHI